MKTDGERAREAMGIFARIHGISIPSKAVRVVAYDFSDSWLMIAVAKSGERVVSIEQKG